MIELIKMKLKDIRPYEKNPRKNDEAVEKVANSIRDFGYKQPIVVDKDGVIIVGHTRYKALKKLGIKEVGVIVADDLTEEQTKAYRIADNSTGEIATWDYDLLIPEVAGLDFDMADYGLELPQEDVELEDVVDDDYVEPENLEPKVKRGEVWKCGDHLLMCGDSTSQEDVKVLMSGNLADMVFTDPPWNVNYGDPVHSYNPRWKNGRTILNDSMDTEDFKEFMGAAFESMKSAIKGGGMIYVVMSAQEWGNMMLELKDKGMHWSSTVIWTKDTAVLSRKDYNTQYEPIWYGWEDSASRAHPVEDHTQTDVWQIKRPKRSDEHPTMKPVELVARAILNSSNMKEKVLDLFGGSGTTMIACEETGRQCFMMELDPHYCDVIIDRWETHTGKKAEKVVA